MKKCPFCSEEIQDSAKKCKHCGEWLTKDEKIPPLSTQKHSKIKYYNLIWLLSWIIFTIIFSRIIYIFAENTWLYSNIILMRRAWWNLTILYILYLVWYLAWRWSMKKINSDNFLRKVITGIIVWLLIISFFWYAQINWYKN